MRLVIADRIVFVRIDLHKIDEVHQVAPGAMLNTDCKYVYAALEKNESITPCLSEQRTSVEVQASKQHLCGTRMTT